MKLYVVDYDDSSYDMVDYGIAGIFSAKKKARELLSSAFIEAPNMNELADRIVDCIYRKEEEK